MDISDFLSDLNGSEISDLESLTGGDWSRAYGFKAQGKDFVARFGRYRDDFEKDRAASRFSTQNMPVPQVHWLVPAEDQFCCVSERLFGNRIEDANSTQIRALVPALLRLVDELRVADVALWTGQVGKPFCSWSEQLLSVDEESERVYGWHDRIAASSAGVGPFQIGMDALKDLIGACPPDLHLRHNDLLHYNVLYRDDKITAVFDWGCAGLGDFLYDLAIFQFYRPWFPAMAEIDWAEEAKAHYRRIGMVVPEFDKRLRCYQIHVGLAGMAYCGFIDDPAELRLHTDRLLQIVRSGD